MKNIVFDIQLAAETAAYARALPAFSDATLAVMFVQETYEPRREAIARKVAKRTEERNAR